MENLTKPIIQDWLIERVASKLGCDSKEITTDKNLSDFGFDSTDTLLMIGDLEKRVKIKLKSNTIYYYPTIEKLSAFIEDEIKNLR